MYEEYGYDYTDSDSSNDASNMWSGGRNANMSLTPGSGMWSSGDVNSPSSEATGSYAGEADSSYMADTDSEDTSDDLISQIDALRSKAARLQSLVSEREQQAGEYSANGGGSADISRELNRMIQSVNTSISAITSRLNSQDNTLAGIESSLSRQDSALSAIDSKLASQDAALSTIDSKLGAGDDVATGTEDVNSAMSSLEETLNDIKDSLDKLSSDTKNMQGEISEKIHSENVKVYRNINDVIKDNDRGDANKEEIISKIKGAKSSANLAMIFGLVDLLGIGSIVYLMLKMVGMI